MKKAIVTGANGFVGSAVCRELINCGTEVIAVVRENSDNIADIPNIRIVQCDMANYASLPNLIGDRDIDVLYHFAWCGSAGKLRADDVVQLKNVQQTCDLVRVCAEMNCRRFVFAASIMEYETAAIMESEQTPSAGSLYCTAKITADYMARAIAGAVGVEYMRGVISNIYGPGEISPRLINTSIRKLLNGEHCAFSPGEQMYDFIYITDAAKEFAEIGEKGRNNGTYYIGSPSPKPLKEFLLEMRDCIASNAEIGLGEFPFNGVSLTYKELDIDSVRKDTGFVPEVSFSEGIRRTAEWLKGAM
mgnify:CR=1 FL=1